MVTLATSQPTDNTNLDDIKLLNTLSQLNFNGRAINSFVASPKSDGSIHLHFTGSLFTYVPIKNTPLTGTIKTLTNDHNGTIEYKITDTSIPVTQIKTFANPVNLFGHDDMLGGSQANDKLWGYAGNDQINARAGDDKINGGAGNDIINGGQGGDRMTGGGGNDKFVFNSALNANDEITDFLTKHDQLQLENRLFPKIGTAGKLDPNVFHVGDHTTSADQHILYNPDATSSYGVLYYTPDGTTLTAFAKIDGGVHLAAGDFLVI